MTEMEDSGFLGAIERLDHMHRVDPRRVMVLRTGSNFCVPPPGHTAVESVTAPSYVGMRVSLESGWMVGSTVVHYLASHWETTQGHIPGD